MSRPPGLPTPQSQRIFQIVLVAFLAALVGTAIFGWFVVSKAKRDAATTDESIRLVGWWCLLHADQSDGAFPDSWETLTTTPWRDQLDSLALSTPPTNWPLTPKAAGIGAVADPPGALKAARDVLTVAFRPDGGPPPIVSEGHSSFHGTLETVNGWLTAAAQKFQSIPTATTSPAADAP